MTGRFRTPPVRRFSVPTGGVYTFARDIHSALDAARAAGDGDGDGDVGRAAATSPGSDLRAGLIDEISIHLAPVIFGSGTALRRWLAARRAHEARDDPRGADGCRDAPPLPCRETTQAVSTSRASAARFGRMPFLNRSPGLAACQPWKSSGSTSSRNRLNSSSSLSSFRSSASSAGMPAASRTSSATQIGASTLTASATASDGRASTT